VATKRKYIALEQENSQLRHLYKLVREESSRNAFDIFLRMRNSDDPIALLQSVGNTTGILPNPSTYSVGDKRIDDIDTAALLNSCIQVPARPWTSVANDGLVSDLISSFFTWDRFLYPFVHQQAFLHEMRFAGAQGANYCSPLLVNAICSLRSVII
jgi:hypothetical protein